MTQFCDTFVIRHDNHPFLLLGFLLHPLTLCLMIVSGWYVFFVVVYLTARACALIQFMLGAWGVLGPCWVWGIQQGQGWTWGSAPDTHSQRGGKLLNREFRRALGDTGEVRDIWELVTEMVRSCPEEVRSSLNTLHLKPKRSLFTWPFKALDGRPLSVSPASVTLL